MSKIKISNARVKFEPIVCEAGANLRDELTQHGVPVASSCDGDGICGKCAVRICSQGTQALTPLSDFEKETLHRNNKDPGEFRLSCQTQVLEDIVIDASYW